MKKYDISFNMLMQQFRHEIEKKKLKQYMLPYWKQYQYSRFMESYLPAYKKCMTKKPVFTIIKELLSLMFYWKCVPYHYFRYALYNSTVSKVDIKNYLPETVFYYRILPHLNRNHCLLDNKFNCSDILSANHLLIPETILKVIGKTVFDSQGNVIEDELTLQKYLNSLSLQEIIAKKANCGSGGKQILIFRKTQGQYSCGSTVLSYTSLQEQFNDWLFQRDAREHTYISRGSSIFFEYVSYNDI